MEVSLNFTKSVPENANIYYDKAKKAKKKLEGAQKALEVSKQKLAKLLVQKEKMEEKIANHVVKAARKKRWYEKFRWFHSSEGFLVIGGRDVVTNEIVIKKHTENHDVVFHTDMQGSPFFVIQTEGKKVGDKTLSEAAAATAMYSRAWKLGFVNVKVGWVNPDQVSKTAKHGEYLVRGSFIISGKMHYVEHDMRFAIGVLDDVIIAGPYNAITEQTGKFVEIVQGDEKPSAIAKKLKKLFGAGTLDEIIRMLPAGNCKIKKR